MDPAVRWFVIPLAASVSEGVSQVFLCCPEFIATACLHGELLPCSGLPVPSFPPLVGRVCVALLSTLRSCCLLMGCSLACLRECVDGTTQRTIHGPWRSASLCRLASFLIRHLVSFSCCRSWNFVSTAMLRMVQSLAELKWVWSIHGLSRGGVSSVRCPWCTLSTPGRPALHEKNQGSGLVGLSFASSSRSPTSPRGTLTGAAVLST